MTYSFLWTCYPQVIDWLGSIKTSLLLGVSTKVQITNLKLQLNSTILVFKVIITNHTPYFSTLLETPSSQSHVQHELWMQIEIRLNLVTQSSLGNSPNKKNENKKRFGEILVILLSAIYHVAEFCHQCGFWVSNWVDWLFKSILTCVT